METISFKPTEHVAARTFINKVGTTKMVVTVNGPDNTPLLISWNGEGTIASINRGNVLVGRFLFPNTGDGDIVFESDDAELIKVVKFYQDSVLTTEKLSNTIFKNIPMASMSSSFGDFRNGAVALFELEKLFKSSGIENVFYYDRPKDIDNLSMDKLTLFITPKHNTGPHDERLSADGILPPSWQETEQNFIIHANNCQQLSIIKGERCTELTYNEAGKKYFLGKYYKDRNLITLSFNPFHRSFNFLRLDEYEKLKTVLAELFTALKNAGVKTIKNNEFTINLMAFAFNNNARKELIQLGSEQAQITDEIRSYNTALIDSFSRQEYLQQRVEQIKVILSSGTKSFLEEVKKTADQPIVTSVEIKDGTINITFKPTTIGVDFMRSVDLDETIGPREIYVGAITLQIGCDNTLKVTCDTPANRAGAEIAGTKYAHPHVGADRSPCLGAGDGGDLIRKLIAERKYSELVYPFWMWIHSWRPADCYVKPWEYYDDRLQRGLPVFDYDGKRIDINDKKRIASGEQIKLEKLEEYEENKKRFKKFKSELH